MTILHPGILAYLDPFTGSIIIQVVIASVVGVIFFFKRIWWKGREAARKLVSHKAPQQDTESSNEEAK